ncbi:iron-containing redox enzyme family protein [Flavobacterium undicola]|uniref:iron-containing redox enzyme family protein n=1 Tax=Flavobacterium undicola TaxID=1932779 RepID=UPI001376BD95|nr:iron-containing redox enzyme family protein [Flavobacterium undicola]MBA0882483.1 iron-containing redox enzyme family protein [Flavobacterium undicola]
MEKTLSEIQKELKADPKRLELVSHQFLKKMKGGQLTRDEVSMVVGQWYYPLENFPFFLSKSISNIKNTSIQSFISDILHEELGCGNPNDSHLELYISTCVDVGLDEKQIANSPAFDATNELIKGYKAAAEGFNSSLGFLYATEVADLVMVSSIGLAISKISGKQMEDLPWVDIHVKQEPNHVKNVDNVLDIKFEKERVDEILRTAREMWNLWINFFTEIDLQINKKKTSVA